LMNLKQYLNQRKELIEEALKTYLPPEDAYPPILHQAMHYSVFAGGKRIRPILHLATVEASHGAADGCMPFACALELIHTYSLIHDDLPAMDNDDLRRGKPTSHVVFGEAVAILAGDALLTEAFRLTAADEARSRLDPQALLRATVELAQAAGAQGMVGGQVMDIVSEGREVVPQVLDYIHTHKTGALIRASVRTGAILAGVSDGVLDQFERFGAALGLAFQIRDDILNVEGDPARLGKAVRSDVERGKATFPALYGLEKSRARLSALVEEALQALAGLDQGVEPLREIARYMVSRDQ
jgi:geranylgeranyl diphosphate synthase, type II